MFSAFTSFSSPISFPRFLQSKDASAIDLPSVHIHDVDTNPEKKARTLKHLLKLNHANHAVIYHQLHFHNHMTHILGSSYLLGASSKHLDDIYEAEAKELEPWTDSPHEISTFDWRDYLGDPKYQRAYLDFFEDQNVLGGYNWKKILNSYLFQGKHPLFNNLISGLGHPLIHLGYAYELDSPLIAMEALTVACTQYNFMHKYLDEPSYSHASSPIAPSTSTLDLLHRISEDPRFDNRNNPNSIASLFENHESDVLNYWNAWQLSSPKQQFEESQRTAATLLVGSYDPDGSKTYDFFLVHLLTTSHAVRILFPLIPSQHHLTLVRQWWLIVIAIYITQGRPQIDANRFLGHDASKGWGGVVKVGTYSPEPLFPKAIRPGNRNVLALWMASLTSVPAKATEGEWSLDSHFVKGLRAMKVAAETWGDNEGVYLKAATKMAVEFDGWGGFGSMEAVEGRRGSGCVM